MEAAEDTSLEPAIGWLAQSILETLLIDKLDAWIRRAGLDDDVEKLKSEVHRVEVVVGAVRGRATGNNPLSRSLARLKDLLYHADDLVDELDYYRLQQQVEGATYGDPRSMHGAHRVDEGSGDIPNIGGGKLRSKYWKNFKITRWDNGKAVEAKCNHCSGLPIKCGSRKNGTSVLSNHLKSKRCIRKRGELPNPSSNGDATETATPIVIGNSSSRKRKKRSRAAEKSTQITAAANRHIPWDKDELSKRIQGIIGQLQDIRGKVSEVLKLHGPDSGSISNHHRGTTSYQYLRTSSLVPRKVYGRVEEKKSIVNLITEIRSESVAVLPIVGIGGVGKTTLAQLVYNDPDVESQFDHRLWVWVSHDFDKVRLTMEMLDFVSRERHEGISSFAKLQETLKKHMEYQSKRFLLILDDVWDNLDDYQWNELLAPLTSVQVKGNVILVTTRNLFVAQRRGTLESLKLCGLADDDFWLLLKSRAFGDENYEGNQSLSIIGRQIAKKLKGNPLAAETAGELLREHLTIDHWSNVLKDEHWKSLQLCRGIMPALKLSYDRLPYHLQQCFSYGSIFPSSYQFLGKELVLIWISQGFVKCNHASKRLEEIGRYYLTVLVNLGFIQQVEKYLSSQPCYTICGLMHDFARIVSRTECTIIDGLRCNEMLPTVRHLSIVSDSAYSEDHYGQFSCNEKFEENLRNTVTSVSKLRTLVLIGHYGSFFLQLIQNIFQKARNLRLLQTKPGDFNSFKCGLENSVHLRYLKCSDEDLPQVLVKFLHLQVLDVISDTDPIVPNGMHNLVSLRHIVAQNEVYSSIASIGSMTSLQELHDFKVQFCSSGFEITQLHSMNELVQLGVSQLEDVKSRDEACGAKLRDKRHLEELHLSWKDTLSDDDYASDKGKELLPMDDGGPSSETSMDKAKEVLEALEPHMDLKHLRISGYSGATSPTWLASNISVTSLQTLQLDDCGGWQILPSLESLPFLTKLKLSNLLKVIEVSIPSVEELVLIKMPKLERCSCTSVEGLSSSLRTMQIGNCKSLKSFDLFETNYKFKAKQKSWLPGLEKLVMRDCPHLAVLNPLPPSATLCNLFISRVSTLPGMDGSFGETLEIGSIYEYTDDDAYADEFEYFDESSVEWILDDDILAFHNLRSLKFMKIDSCQNLTSIPFESFSHLVSLKSLEIIACEKLFSSHVMPEHIHEDMPAANYKAFPSLESLTITLCGIMGKWLSLMLRHSPDLEELVLYECPHITLLSIEEGENSQSNLISPYHESGNPDDLLAWFDGDELLHIPFNLLSSLKKITIEHSPGLTFEGSEKGFSVLTSLEKLKIWRCPELLSSLVHNDRSDDKASGKWLLPTSLRELHIGACYQKKLQPCFPSKLTNLKKARVEYTPGLESLQLHSCTALEELAILSCQSLTSLEGLQSLGSLRHLALSYCPGLPSYLESFSRQDYALCPGLASLRIDDPSVLTTSFCNKLTSLQCLQLEYLVGSEATSLTNEQERALLLLKSLQELQFYCCNHLVDLPAGLHTLASLRRLKICGCSRISRLPETGLPLSLEELDIRSCSKDLTSRCTLLATSKLNVHTFL